LQVAAELKVPIKKAFVYAFAEHGNDLGSSKDVREIQLYFTGERAMARLMILASS